MKTAEAQPKLKRIEHLTLREFDMAYSLTRTGWSYAEVGKRFGISDTDVRRVVDDYVDLRRLCQERPAEKGLDRGQEPELVTKKLRKRRCDSKYATARER